MVIKYFSLQAHAALAEGTVTKGGNSARALSILSRAERSTAFAHHEARSTSTSAEPERRRLVLESPSAALSGSPQPGPSTHGAFRSLLEHEVLVTIKCRFVKIREEGSPILQLIFRWYNSK